MSRCLNWLFVCACTMALVGGLAGHLQTFTRCQLTKELQRYTFPRNLIARWVCIIEHASGRTTNKTTSNNSGHISYGLFQISNKAACMKGKIGGYCKLKCEDLLNLDLADDVLCAKRVYEKSGFKAWPTAYTFCKDKNIPDLSKC